jgi:hypothetical protein
MPKDFDRSAMITKHYLIAPAHRSLTMPTPSSFGIERLQPPRDLDIHLTDLFVRQEDERYRLKLRHQVERVRALYNKRTIWMSMIEHISG